MRGLLSVAAGFLLMAITACANDPAAPSIPVVTSLSCSDGAQSEAYVACTLQLEQPAGFKVRVTSTNCRAHGNVFRITAPMLDTLVTDGCYAPVGTEIVHSGPFPVGTSIAAEVIAPLLANAPELRVTGGYPEWTLKYEDGVDDDFDDLIMVLTAIPQEPIE